jgi:hypothetical protein
MQRSRRFDVESPAGWSPASDPVRLVETSAYRESLPGSLPLRPATAERNLSSRAQEYLENAQRCEFLAKDEKDAAVRTALIHAARQWRNRALLARHAHERFRVVNEPT